MTFEFVLILFFPKLDLKDGYWYVKVTEESSFLTTFSTPFGKFRFNRLPFGLCMSQDVFLYKVDEKVWTT